MSPGKARSDQQRTGPFRWCVDDDRRGTRNEFDERLVATARTRIAGRAANGTGRRVVGAARWIAGPSGRPRTRVERGTHASFGVRDDRRVRRSTACTALTKRACRESGEAIRTDVEQGAPAAAASPAAARRFVEATAIVCAVRGALDRDMRDRRRRSQRRSPVAASPAAFAAGRRGESAGAGGACAAPMSPFGDARRMASPHADACLEDRRVSCYNIHLCSRWFSPSTWLACRRRGSSSRKP
jgi:hypothetical protein